MKLACSLGIFGLFLAIGAFAQDPAQPIASTGQKGELVPAAFRAYMVVAAVGTVLAAGYLLWLYQRAAFGEPKGEFEHEHFHDVHVPEWIAWTPLLIGIVALGVFPKILFQISDPAVHALTKAFGG